MGKQSDRAVRLAVFGFALVLTVVSSTSALIHGHSRDPHRGIRSVSDTVGNQAASPIQKSGRPTAVEKDMTGITGTGVTYPTQAALLSGPYSNPVDSLLHLKPIVQAGIPVVVVGVGTDTPSSALTQVKSLIEKHQIIATDAHTLGLTTGRTIYIYLAQSQQDYNQELRRIGLSVQQAQSLSLDTGGFTQGSSVIIPLFQNTAVSDLANTIGHELTHAILNANVSQLPSWINEGIAVTNGMNTQKNEEGPVAYGGYARRMAEEVLDATSQGQLIALTADESKVLQGNPTYDLELQDWLAVSQLIKQHGTAAFTNYFNRLHNGESFDSAFQHAFGVSSQSFNSTFTRFLQKGAHASDPGVRISLNVASTYRGNIRVLQHGSQLWRGVKAVAGQVNISVNPNGSITSASSPTATRSDSNPPDNTTLYVNLDPAHPLTYKGNTVQDCGFAFDYHDGLYGYVNTWITLKNGQTVYVDNLSLFGVTLSSVKESSRANDSLAQLFSVLSSN